MADEITADSASQYFAQQKQRAMGNQVGGQGVSPENAVEALRQQRLGGPPASLGMYAPQAPQPVPAIPSPAVVRFTQDPARAAAVGDDHAGLNRLNKANYALTGPNSFAGDLAHPAVEGFHHYVDAIKTLYSLNPSIGWWDRVKAAGSAIGSGMQIGLSPIEGPVNATIGRPLSYVPVRHLPTPGEQLGLGFALQSPFDPNNWAVIARQLALANASPPQSRQERQDILTATATNALLMYTPVGETRAAGEVVAVAGEGKAIAGVVDGAALLIIRGFPTERAAKTWAGPGFDVIKDPVENSWIAQGRPVEIHEPFAPSPGVNPTADAVYSHAAVQDEMALASVEQAVVETKTHGRDPALIEEFLAQDGDGVVHVSPQAIYSAREAEPGLFADHSAAIDLAASRGADVEIPTSQYLAQVAGKPFADELRQGVKLSGEGVNLTEAKELPEPKEDAEVVTVYHGTDQTFDKFNPDFVPERGRGSSPGTISFSTDETVASGYGARTVPVELDATGFGDYMKPEDVEKVVKYYIENSPGIAGQALEQKLAEARRGDYSLWDNRDMWKALGWEGSFVSEFRTEEAAEHFDETGEYRPEDLVRNVITTAPERAKVIEAGSSPEYSFSDEDFEVDTEDLPAVEAIKPEVKSAVIKAAKNNYLTPLFKDAKAIGMTEGQFSRYAKRIEEAVGEAYRKVVKRVIAQLKKERTPEWKETLSQRLAEVEAELSSRPDVIAAYYLRYNQHPNGAELETPGMKIDYDLALAAYGKVFVESLPKQIFKHSSQQNQLTRRGLFTGAAGSIISTAARAATRTSVTNIASVKAAIDSGSLQKVIEAIRDATANSAFKELAHTLALGGVGNAKIKLVDYGDAELALAGRTDIKSGDVTINKTSVGDSGDTEETILHEAIHSYIAKRYRTVSSYLPSNKKRHNIGTQNADQFITGFQNLWSNFTDVMGEKFPNLVDEDSGEIWAIESYNNPDELFVRVFTDPNLQEFLRGINLKGEKVKPQQKSFWTAFIDLIARLFGAVKKTTKTALSEIMDAANSVLRSGALDKPTGEVAAKFDSVSNLNQRLSNVFSPDEAAELLGFNTGKEMLDAVGELFAAVERSGLSGLKEYLSQQAKVVATLSARAETGFDMTPTGLQLAAQEALASPQVADLLIDELASLAKTAQLPFDKEAVKFKAQSMFNDLTVKQALNIREYERLVSKHGRNAEIGLLKNKPVEAFTAKQYQVLNQLMLQMAHAFGKEVAKANRSLGVWGKKSSRAGMEQKYLDRIHAAMKVMGLKVPRLGDELLRALGNVSYSAFVDSRADRGIYLADAALSGKLPKDQKVTEFKDVMAMLYSLAEAGRAEKKVWNGYQEEERDEFIQQMLETAAGLPSKKPPAGVGGRKSGPEKLTSVGRGIDAYLGTIQRFLAYLDGNATTGPWQRGFMSGAIQAANTVHDLQNQFFHPLEKDFGQYVEKEVQRAYGVKLIDHPLRDPRTGFTTSMELLRGDVLPILMNMGNAANLQRLADGYGTTADELIKFIDQHLSEGEAKWATFAWEKMEELFPLVDANTRKLTGIGVAKVEALPVPTKYGLLTGGYWPIVYDSTLKVHASEEQAIAEGDKEADKLISQPFRRVATPSGFEQTRTSGSTALFLSLDGVLKKHLDDVFTRIGYGQYIRSAYNLLHEGRVRDVINAKLGPEYYKNIQDWMEFLVYDGTVPQRGQEVINRLLHIPRNRLQLTVIGGSISVAVNQMLGLFASISELGMGKTLVGGAKFYMLVAQGKMENRILSKSHEMRRRMHDVDQNLSSLYQEMRSITRGQLGVEKFRKQWAEGMMSMVGLADRYLVSGITWQTAYDKFLSETRINDPHSQELAAIDFADKMVVKTQGSGAQKDLSGVRRTSNEYQRMYTLFYSWPEAFYNLQVEILRDFKQGRWASGLRKGWWLWVVSPLVAAYATDQIPPKAKKSPEAFTTWALTHSLTSPTAGIPIIRDFANFAERRGFGQYSDLGGTPVNRAFESVYKVATNKKTAPTPIKDAGVAAGMVGIIPAGGSQIGKSGQYLWDRLHGKHSDDNIIETTQGIIQGPKK